MAIDPLRATTTTIIAAMDDVTTATTNHPRLVAMSATYLLH
jgi:hypothetical protein